MSLILRFGKSRGFTVDFKVLDGGSLTRLSMQGGVAIEKVKSAPSEEQRTKWLVPNQRFTLGEVCPFVGRLSLRVLCQRFRSSLHFFVCFLCSGS